MWHSDVKTFFKICRAVDSGTLTSTRSSTWLFMRAPPSNPAFEMAMDHIMIMEWNDDDDMVIME